MKNIFTHHPHSVGESYFQHLKFASYFGIQLFIGGIACLVHAIFPFFFEKTGSQILLKMTHHFVDRMPHVESRVLSICQLVEKKLEKSSSYEIKNH